MHSLLSRLTLHWLGPFLDVGFSRPLMEDGMPILILQLLDIH